MATHMREGGGTHAPPPLAIAAPMPRAGDITLVVHVAPDAQWGACELDLTFGRMPRRHRRGRVCPADYVATLRAMAQHIERYAADFEQAARDECEENGYDGTAH